MALLVTGAVVLALLFVGVAALIVASVDGVASAKFWEFAAQAALTVAAGLIITGGVGVVVQTLRDRDEDDRGERAFVEAQVVQLWELHDQVKTAAVLVAAHQTAKTYGEQMRVLIGTRTRLSDVEGVIRRQLGRNSDVTGSVGEATRFLHSLVDEYRSRYLDVSYRQRIDEAANKRLDEKGVYRRAARSTLAWDMLHDAEEFQELAHLISFGELTAADFDDPEDVWKSQRLQVECLDKLTDAISILRE